MHKTMQSNHRKETFAFVSRYCLTNCGWFKFRSETKGQCQPIEDAAGL